MSREKGGRGEGVGIPGPISGEGPPATDIWWSSLETCSNLAAIETYMVASGRYASYWNAFCFEVCIANF